MASISHNEIQFHPSSFADPDGRLFWYKGKLCRGIYAERAALYRSLFEGGVIQSLIDKGLLIETELTEMELDDYGLILNHRCLPFVSYPYEWCAEMLKDAALLIIDLELAITQYGLTLQDAHPWNVLFDNSHPKYVDFGSIVPCSQETGGWSAYEEFCRFSIYPLQLMAAGHERIARWFLYDNIGVLANDKDLLLNKGYFRFRPRQAFKNRLPIIKKFLPKELHPLARKSLKMLNANLSKLMPFRPHSKLEFMQQVRKYVEDIDLHLAQTEWSNYYKDYPPFKPSVQWTQKNRSVYEIILDRQPRSILDIGCNQGWYSRLAANLGNTVVAFDADIHCVSQLYLKAKENNEPILPLVIDFRNPSPGYGLCNQQFAPAMQRLRCEMVLALALVHHLVFKNALRFEQIVAQLFAFSSKWLIVEFIPRDDDYVRHWWSEKHSWYTLENFVTEIKKYFKNVIIYPSYPDPRVLLLCEK